MISKKAIYSWKDININSTVSHQILITKKIQHQPVDLHLFFATQHLPFPLATAPSF